MGLIMPSLTVLDERYNEPSAAVEIAGKSSNPYTDITRSMLKLSTNLTAEVIGLTASDAPNLKRSVAALTRFAEAHGMWSDCWIIRACRTARASQLVA